mgnify:FL=1
MESNVTIFGDEKMAKFKSHLSEDYYKKFKRMIAYMNVNELLNSKFTNNQISDY